MARRHKGRYDTDLYALPSLLPIPSFDCHIIASGQDDTGGGVDGEAANVVRVSLEGGYFLVGVVVEDTKLEIVRTSDKPVLARDKLDASDRDL